MSADSNQPVSSAPPANESSSDATVPIWLIVLLFFLLFSGAWYFDNHGAWFSPNVYAPYRSVAELEPYHQLAGPPDARVLGIKVYNKPTCFQCHQANGMGQPGQFPPLAGSEWVNEPEPGRIIRIVLNGLTGPITIKGQPWNATMVRWGLPIESGGLSDEEIAAVLTYVRSEWGNKAPPVTAERVKAVREKIKDHPKEFTADELLKISPAE